MFWVARRALRADASWISRSEARPRSRSRSPNIGAGAGHCLERRTSSSTSSGVSEHQHMVYCVALSFCKDSSLAEDVAQEAFLKAYRSVDEMREPARLKTWLYSIARFTAIDWLRRRKHEKFIGLAPETMELPER